MAWPRSTSPRTSGGEVYPVFPGLGWAVVQDVTDDGAWLVTRKEISLRIMVHAPDSSRVQDLSWLGASVGPILSADGRLLTSNDQSAQAGANLSVMVRETDGSPVTRLGDGFPRGLSPDNRWNHSLPTASPSDRYAETAARSRSSGMVSGGFASSPVGHPVASRASPWSAMSDTPAPDRPSAFQEGQTHEP